MANYRVSESQSFLDIAIQKSGSIVSVFDLAVENDLSITDDLKPGQVLELVDVSDADVFAYYEFKSLVPATALSVDDQLVVAELEGISYWAINIDFVVQ